MQENQKQAEPPAPAHERRLDDFGRALLFSAIPFVLLAIAAALTKLGAAPGLPIDMYALDWVFGGVLVVGAVIAGAVLGGMGKRRLGAGVFAGMGIGVVVLAQSCFAVGSL